MEYQSDIFLEYISTIEEYIKDIVKEKKNRGRKIHS